MMKQISYSTFKVNFILRVGQSMRINQMNSQFRHSDLSMIHQMYINNVILQYDYQEQLYKGIQETIHYDPLKLMMAKTALIKYKKSKQILSQDENYLFTICQYIISKEIK
ncbi:hypothetical protein pb186bvf_000818 [Paramecium bursaria]